MKSPYEILGVDRSATPEQIKKKYKSLCGKYHPDKGGDEKKFKEVQEAYKKITEPEKVHHDFSGFNNSFSFPVQIFLQLTLEEAFNGCSKRISIDNEIVDIPIPSGTNPTDGFSGNIILPSGKKVLIMCQLSLKPHDVYELSDNLDLICYRTISLLDYYTGTTLKVTDLENKTYAVKIKPQTESESIRINGKGFKLNSYPKSGNIIIKISIDLPDLSPEKIVKLQELLTN
jgi:DnaJ-class molecular chaperone